MADNQSREISKLHVKVEVDVSEALTGLKALQREAKKATHELNAMSNAGWSVDNEGNITIEGVLVEGAKHEYRVKEHATQPGTGVVIDDTNGKPIKFFDIGVFSTKSLARELSKRNGVETTDIESRGIDESTITINWRETFK